MENINQTTSSVMETDQPSSVTQPPFGSWWKVGGLVLGAVILASGIFFAGYQYSQKQVKPTTPPTVFPTPTSIADPTANWKTYTNTKIKFSLKYPSGWSDPQENLLSTRTEINFQGRLIIDTGSYYNQNLQRELTLEEYINRFHPDPGSSNAYIIESMHGKRIVNKTSAESVEDVVILADSSTSTSIFTITYIYNPSIDESAQTFNQILSTIRFSVN